MLPILLSLISAELDQPEQPVLITNPDDVPEIPDSDYDIVLNSENSATISKWSQEGAQPSIINSNYKEYTIHFEIEHGYVIIDKWDDMELNISLSKGKTISKKYDKKVHGLLLNGNKGNVTFKSKSGSDCKLKIVFGLLQESYEKLTYTTYSSGSIKETNPSQAHIYLLAIPSQETYKLIRAPNNNFWYYIPASGSGTVISDTEYIHHLPCLIYGEGQGDLEFNFTFTGTSRASVERNETIEIGNDFQWIQEPTDPIKLPTWAIVLIVVVAVIAGIVFLVWYLKKRKTTQVSNDGNNQTQTTSEPINNDAGQANAGQGQSFNLN